MLPVVAGQAQHISAERTMWAEVPWKQVRGCRGRAELLPVGVALLLSEISFPT